MDKIKQNINGIKIIPLRQINDERGAVYHVLNSTDSHFTKFGEAYFSEITHNNTKGWKKHTRMTMNLVIISGTVRFVLFDDRKFSNTSLKFWEIEIGEKNYKRLTIPPGIYVAFRGIEKRRNLVLNLASIEHDPFESENLDLDEIKYKWE